MANTSIAEVSLWGRTIGAVSWDARRELGSFEYAPDFTGSGIELSPLTMPLSSRIYTFPALPRDTFKGLPGMLADSLPDDFGNALINAWLAEQGREASSFNPVERLCYVGSRGMGALEYAPSKGPGRNQTKDLDIEALVALASNILNRKESLDTSFADKDKHHALNEILRVGTSAGGARAKAIIAWNRDSNEVKSGQVDAGSGFSYWILKLDGVEGNRDKESADPQGYGLIEFAYYNMARAAGIEMEECRLFREGGRSHFMTQRFDRDKNGMKLHMQSLGALEHFDYRRPGAYSYEQALQTIRKLELSANEVEQQFRRMAFNIISRNQDDHVKNISFLMDPGGTWHLSPAYDVTYSYNPQGEWTGQHQMSLNGKRDDFTLEDFRACASAISMKRGLAEQIVEDVTAVVGKWQVFAEQAGIDEQRIRQISKTLRLDLAGRQ